MRRVVLFGLLLLCGCHRRDASDGVKPLPLAEQDSATQTPPLPGQLAVTARITGYMGIGWGHVFPVKLDSEPNGTAALYVPASHALAKAILGDGGSVSGVVLRLVLAPIEPPANGGGPYSLHLRKHDDAGSRYWSVIRADQ